MAPRTNAVEIALASAIDHYDFRKNIDWRPHAPNLEAWMVDFAKAVPRVMPKPYRKA